MKCRGKRDTTRNIPLVYFSTFHVISRKIGEVRVGLFCCCLANSGDSSTVFLFCIIQILPSYVTYPETSVTQKGGVIKYFLRFFELNTLRSKYFFSFFFFLSFFREFTAQLGLIFLIFSYTLLLYIHYLHTFDCCWGLLLLLQAAPLLFSHCSCCSNCCSCCS